MLEDGDFHKGVTEVSKFKAIHRKPEGKNKNEVMRFFPHDHLC